MENKEVSSFKNAFLGINKKDKPLEEKKQTFLTVKTKKTYRNIKQNIIKWLLTDMGDNMILLDFLLISFEHILNSLPNRKITTSHKHFFTKYVNWLYKYSSANKYK
jgi:hypothetical protein